MSIGEADGQFENYAAELNNLAGAYAVSPELQDLWSNPAYSREQRLAGARRIAEHFRVHNATGNLMMLLVERSRGGQIAEIARAFGELVDEKLGRVRATVTSAHPLSDDQIVRLQQALGGKTGGHVTIATRVDPSIIGGVVAQVGSIVHDASVRTQLERLRAELRSH